MAAVYPSEKAAVESGETYRLIADTIPHLVWTARADGWVDFYNREFQSYCGLDAAALAGWGWKPVLHPDDLERVLAAWTQALETGAPYRIECRIRRADGAMRWHLVTAEPARDAQGRIVRWFGTCTDIQAQAALRESEERFRSLTQLTADVFWEQDAEYRFTSFTQSGHMRHNLRRPGVLLGKRRWEIGFVNMSEADWAGHRAVLDAREPFYELELCRIEDGESFWISTSGQPVFDGLGAFKGYRGVGRDITERKRAEALLRLEHAVTRCLAEAETAAGGIAGVIRAICESQNWACGRYFELDEAAGLLRFAGAWGIENLEVQAFIAASSGVTYRCGEGLTGRAWESGEPLCVRDFANDARATGPSAGLAAGKAALAGGAFIFPLISGGKTIGALCFSSAEVRAPEERLLRAVQVIGSQVAQFLERKRGEEVLRESERRFALFVDHAPCMVWFKDSSLRYTYVNGGWEKTNRRSAKDVIGRIDSDVFPAEMAQLIHSSDEEVLEVGGVVQRLRAIPQTWRDWDTNNTALLHYLIVKFPLTDASGKLGVGGIGLDLTERVEAEELAQSYAADVRRLLTELVSAQESERRRLADELHDLIGQNLTAIGIELGGLKDSLAAAKRAQHGPRLDAMAALLDGTVDAIRGVMTELRPPALEEFGLVPALRSHAAEFGKRTRMKVSVSVSSPARRLPPGTELSLFRIAQEALTNAAKHSGARSMSIALSENASGIRMSIEDDGQGFRDSSGARAARRGGWGLQAMRERAEALGGILRIEFPSRGTRVVVELPPVHGD